MHFGAPDVAEGLLRDGAGLGVGPHGSGCEEADEYSDADAHDDQEGGYGENDQREIPPSPESCTKMVGVRVVHITRHAPLTKVGRQGKCRLEIAPTPPLSGLHAAHVPTPMPTANTAMLWTKLLRCSLMAAWKAAVSSLRPNSSLPAEAWVSK
jgi:hypothetical protein